MQKIANRSVFVFRDVEEPLVVLRRFFLQQTLGSAVKLQNTTLLQVSVNKAYEPLTQPNACLVPEVELKVMALRQYVLLWFWDCEDTLYVLGLVEKVDLQVVLENYMYLEFAQLNRFCFEVARTAPVDSYYNLPDILPKSFAEMHEAISPFVCRVFGTRPLTLATGRSVQQNRMGFLGLCMIASMDPLFRERAYATELSLLQQHVSQLSDWEAAEFVRQWFPGKVIVTQCEGFAVAGEPALNKIESDLYVNYLFHQSQYLPCVYYTAPAYMLFSRLPCAALPSSSGTISFAYNELPVFLETAFDQIFRAAVADAQSLFCTSFAHTWDQSFDREKLFKEFKIPRLRENEKDWKFEKIITCARKKQYSEKSALRYVLEKLGPSFLEEMRYNDKLERHESKSQMVAGKLPETRKDLLLFSSLNFPPCVTKYIAECEGVNHMHYADRLRVSALLRRFGFNLDDAQHIFYLMFSETKEHFGQNKGEFLKSKHGQVVASDYASNKQENLGISCMTLIARGKCAFPDIEDLAQSKCNEYLEKLWQIKGKTRKRYPISSPVNFFNQLLKK